MNPAPPVISTTQEVAALAAALAGHERIAIDTEFHPERRYRPALMTVQIATEDDRAWVIDALCCDLAPLSELLGRTCVLLHGGVQDVALLQRACPPGPTRLLDTQRLAGLAGSTYPARLDDLLVAWLGHAPTSSHALTDWSARPLRPDQLRYAVDDARMLFPLVDRLLAALGEGKRQAWGRQASQDLLVEASAPPRALDAWRAWRIAPGFSDDTRRVLHGLMTWRDAAARDINQPPHYILGDAIALALARARPTQVAALADDRRFGKGLRKRFGAEIIASIQSSLDGPAPHPVEPQAPARAMLLQAWAAAETPKSGVSAGLALPPALLQAIAEHGPDRLNGWRADAFGPSLRAFWSGATGLGLDDGRIVATTHHALSAIEPSVPAR
ncbi:MAG: hypothetical protein GXP62_05100 [Oligoflexia bacterium]|nr:hypothetical protein [Oligoflexia bacterium]